MPATPSSPPPRTLLRDLLLPFWQSPQCGPAYLMLAVVLAIAFGGVYLQVWANELLGAFTDAVVKRNWGALKTLFLLSLVATICAGSLFAARQAVFDRLALRWRTWMTSRFLARWTASNAFYAIERDQLLSNADQRISEDVRSFTEMSLDTFVSVLQVSASVVSFSIVLWRLGGNLDLNPWGIALVIPGYLFFAAVLAGGGALLVTHLTGRPLVALTHHNETVEANFRHRAVQLRENAEQVAFFRGGEPESERMAERFAEVRVNRIALIWRTLKLGLVQNAYGHLVHPVPQLLALPAYIAGGLSYGQMMRAIDAYRVFYSSLSYFYQAYVNFARLAAVARRLRELLDAIERVEQRRGGIVCEPAPQDAYASTAPLRLATPDGQPLLALDGFAFVRGQRWLIRGPSGCGKSTLLRALAGLWPYGEGRITVPAGRCMFVPQRSYIPSGTLRAALCYPLASGAFDDPAIRAVLSDCRLDKLASQLDVDERWQQLLSGGEQQRLAIARVLLHRPDFVLLDEASSALDGDTEAHVYGLLTERLPDSGIVSIAHRESIARLHTHVLSLSADGAQAGPLPHAPHA